MTKIVINKATNEVIAVIAKTQEIVKDGYDVINFGNNEPVLQDVCGEIYVKENSFVVDLKGAE